MTEIFDGSFEPGEFHRLKNFILFATIDSTNELARGLIEHAAAEDVPLLPSVVAARSQTRGRGRRDRPWQSPPGGLYATFVFSSAPGPRLGLLPLAAALWTAEALSETTGLATELKWPNDVLCHGRKIAGILTEARTRGDQTDFAVGIGVNVSGAIADLREPGATTAEREAGERPSLAKLFLSLCRRFDDFLRDPRFENIVPSWRERSAHRVGDRMTVLVGEPGAPRRVSGQFAGLNSEGFLCLSTGEGETQVCAGEIQQW